MNPFDRATTQRIWARVLTGQNEQEDQNIAPRETASLPQTLESMISAELADCAVYRQLARQNFAPQVFRSIAAEEACHAQRLCALYFLLAGHRANAERTSVETIGRLPDALRDRFAQEQRSAAGYRTAATAWPSHADFFHSLAADEERHRSRIQALTERLCRRS